MTSAEARTVMVLVIHITGHTAILLDALQRLRTPLVFMSRHGPLYTCTMNIKVLPGAGILVLWGELPLSC